MDELFSSFDLGKTNVIKNLTVDKKEKIVEKKQEALSDDEKEDQQIIDVPIITQKISSSITTRVRNENIELNDNDLEPGNIRNNIIKKLNKQFLFKVINNIMIIELKLLTKYFNLCLDRDDIFKTTNISMRVREKYYCVGEDIECTFFVFDGNLIGKTKDVICFLSYVGIINQKINNTYLLIDKKRSFTIGDKIMVRITKILPSGYCDFFQVEGKIIDITE